MLSLSDRQTHRIADKVFLDRLVRIVHASEPEAAAELGSPAGQQELQRQCAQARRHGLVSEADIGRYVITAWLLGRDFHELPAMRDILSRRDRRPEDRGAGARHPHRVRHPERRPAVSRVQHVLG